MRRAFSIGLAAALWSGVLGGAIAKERAPETESRRQDEKKEEKQAPLLYKSLWKIEVPKATRRVGLADVTGDKIMRLLALGEGGALTVFRVNDQELKAEATLDLGAKAEKFAAGYFVKGKPAVIVTPGAAFIKDGENYRKKDLPGLATVTGEVHGEKGADLLLPTLGQGAPEAFTLDLDGEKPLVSAGPLPNPDQMGERLRDAVLRMDMSQMEQRGLQGAYSKLGVVGMIKPRADNKIYMWVPFVGPQTSRIEVGLPMQQPGEGAPLWKSPTLGGKLVDVTYGVDPKEGKTLGFLVLLATGEKGEGRQIEFWGLTP